MTLTFTLTPARPSQLESTSDLESDSIPATLNSSTSSLGSYTFDRIPAGIEPGHLRTYLEHRRIERQNKLQIGGNIQTKTLNLAPVVFLLAASGLWILAIRTIDPLELRTHTMTALLPTHFFVALGLAVIAAVFFAVVGSRGFDIAITVLLVILHATHPLVFGIARYPWTYKHLGITEQLMSGQGLHTEIDLYQRWIGFFAASASISRAAGINDPEILARWSPLFFQGVLVLAVGYLFRAIGGTTRQRSMATLLFVLGNWVGQDYFAPQAASYVLLIILYGILLRLAPHRPRHRNLKMRFDPASSASLGPPKSRALHVSVAILCAISITVTHQITPVVVVLSAMAMIFMFDLVHPRWIVVAIGTIFATFVGVQLSWLDRRYGVLDFGLLGGNSVAKTNEIGIGPTQQFAANGARGLTLLLGLLAACYVLRNVRTDRTTRLVALLALVPVGLIVLTSYGGEGIYRAFLFSLPWICWLGGGTLSRLRTSFALAIPAAVCVLAAMLFVVAYFGLENLYHVSRESANASKELYSRAEPDSTVLLAAPTGFPIRYSEYYWRVAGAGRGSEGSLNMNSALVGRPLLASDLSEIDSAADALRRGTGPTYLVVSRAQAAWAADAGLWPLGTFENLNETLAAAPGWSIYLKNEDVTVWRRSANPETEMELADVLT
jgi:hypothetical protein